MAAGRIVEFSKRGTRPAPDDQNGSRGGRVVYLAQPGGDMEHAYNRLATEFEGRGYRVVPDVRPAALSGPLAQQFVDHTLNVAELSVHLIGIEDTPDRIVGMQLARARDRARAAKMEGAATFFRRIIWAPRIVEAVGTGSNGVMERDPLDALNRFDQQIATDKIDGDIFGNFIEYLFQYLAETGPRPASPHAPPYEKRPSLRAPQEREKQRSPSALLSRKKNIDRAGDEHGTTRYYVSYARADASDPNREKDVDALCSEAQRRDVKVFRDKDDLQPGRQISSFMQELGEADRVFIFLSDKYLTSIYCMYELFEMWRNSRENKTDFLRHVRAFTVDGT
jgi:hypothetical protein